MTSRMAKKGGRTSARGNLVRGLLLHIRCRPHTSETLARKLGVSVATVARGLVELRHELAREGESLVSVKEGTDWHYEIREREDLWENDPLLRAVGSIKGVRPPAGEGVKDALYGKARATR
jgi:hypothetical protein